MNKKAPLADAPDDAQWATMSKSEKKSRGLYAVARPHVNAQTVASALARKTGEHVRLAPAEGDAGVLMVPTSGLSRTGKPASMRMNTSMIWLSDNLDFFM
jgi:hypothetical protein